MSRSWLLGWRSGRGEHRGRPALNGDLPSGVGGTASTRSAISAHLQAARMAWWMRDARIRPIQALAKGLLALPYLPSGIPVRVARRAAFRACRLVQRIHPPFRSTCITRSLVFAALISDREEVVIHVGFRSAGAGGQNTAEGHAWVTLDGLSVGESDPASALEEASFQRCVELRMARDGAA